MITEDQAIRLLSEANPVPDVSALDLDGTFPTTRLAEYDARSKGMTKPEVDKSPSPTVLLGRRILIGALPVVAVVVLGILILPRMRDRVPVAGQQTTPVETAEAFLEAYRGSFDIDEAILYLGSDPETVGLAPLPEERLFVRFLAATGNKLVNLHCEELSFTADGTVVRCAYVSHSFFSDEMGLGPYGPDGFEFTVVNGEIVAVRDADPDASNNALGFGPFSDEIWVPFAVWIGENHPDDRDVMYEPSATGWRITEESIALWEQRLREYVEEQNPAASGLTGLPPEDATPSTPESGELIASMWEHIGAPGSFGNGWLYLYADGRLIWEQMDPNPTGGWLEQRLTNEGVELIRSEIIATELFDPDQPAPASTGEAQRGSVQVRNGEDLVYVNRLLPELMERLAELWSWLPDDAWEDIEAKPYVPSRYVVCVQDGGSPTDVSDDLSTLPAAARDLLAGAEQIHLEALVSVDPAGFAELEGSTGYCYNLATDEARILATTLDGAGVGELPHPWYGGSEVEFPLTKSVDEYLSNPFDTITLNFWPMLPHGVPAFTGA